MRNTVSYLPFLQAELMGGEESDNLKEIASSSLTEEQKQSQEKLEREQEEQQVQMDVEHAQRVNEMKEELDNDKKLAQETINSQMEEQKRKVGLVIHKISKF